MFEIIQSLLKNGGWISMYDPIAGSWGIEVFQRNDRVVCVPDVLNISEPERIFDRLRDYIESGPPFISDILFKGGASIKIPDWFREFCKARGIQIHILADGEGLPASLG